MLHEEDRDAVWMICFYFLKVLSPFLLLRHHKNITIISILVLKFIINPFALIYLIF